MAILKSQLFAPKSLIGWMTIELGGLGGLRYDALTCLDWIYTYCFSVFQAVYFEAFYIPH